jgi:hypothetical protein
VRSALSTIALPKRAVVLDPWNGSGTTTYSASLLGLDSIGIDINPAINVVAKARLLPQTEVSSIAPLAAEIIAQAGKMKNCCAADDPLLTWFNPSTANSIRALEITIRRLLVSETASDNPHCKINSMSTIASTYYTALFSISRELARVSCRTQVLFNRFLDLTKSMERTLTGPDDTKPVDARCSILLGDSCSEALGISVADLVVTSPPYCTRIDYTAATRIELAIVDPLVDTSIQSLRHSMLGSVCVPKRPVKASAAWGVTCNRFLERVEAHESKASKTYYLSTHLDYFDKLYRSLEKISLALKPRGGAILVVQDSYYKEVHNDIGRVLVEMGGGVGLSFCKRIDFHQRNPLALSHPHSRKYRTTSGATEAVICLSRES